MSKHNQTRISAITQLLTETFHPSQLAVQDDSHLHHGHPGAQSGAGHFSLTIAALAFQNKTLVDSHRMIYQALDNLMGKDIHALRVKIIR